MPLGGAVPLEGALQAVLRVQARVEGTVQGVGFRPFVYRLGERARGSRGGCATTRAASSSRSRGRARRSRPSWSGCSPRLRRWPGSSACAPSRGPCGESRVSASPPGRWHGGAADVLVAPDSATCRDCLAELFDPRRSALPLSVHQLHELRAALHDRARCALRPGADDDGRLSDVRARAAPSTRTPATGAFTPSPTRVRECGPRARLLVAERGLDAGCEGATTSGSESTTRSARAPATAPIPAAARLLAAAPSSRSRGSAATTWPRAPTTRRRWRGCAHASGARTGRSR